MAALRSHLLRSLRNLSTRSAKRPPFSSSVFDRATVISHGVHAILSRDSNRMSARWRVSNSNAGSNYSPLGNGPPNWSDRPPTEMAPLFPGCDYEHWLVVMDGPGDGKATKQEMVDCYVKTLATVLGRRRRPLNPFIMYLQNGTMGLDARFRRKLRTNLKGCLEYVLYYQIHMLTLLIRITEGNYLWMAK